MAEETRRDPIPQHILWILLLISSFFIGSLFTKVQYLEKGATVPVGQGVGAPAAGDAVQPVGKYKTFEEAMGALAKSIKINDKKLLECMQNDKKKAVVDADTTQGNTVGVTGTPAFFVNGRLVAGALPFEEFKKIIDEELGGTADPTTQRVTVDLGNAPTIGKAGAPVTLIEFSDFQCPFCSRSYTTVKQIQKEYGDKVLFAYKHYPLIAIHPRAQKSAEASECAREQGKFWEFHDALFEQQQDWANT